MPASTAVAGEVQAPIVRARPDKPLLVRGLFQTMNGREDFLAEVLGKPRRTGDLHLVGHVVGQIVADDLPGHTFVLSFEYDVATEVDRVGVVRGNKERRLPIKPIGKV